MSTARGVKIPIGRILQSHGKITEDQLKQALALQQTTTEKLGRLLIDLGFVSERDVLSAYAQQLNVAIYDPHATIPDPAVAKLIPDNLAQRYHVAPLRRNGRKLVVAMSDPTNIFAIDELRLFAQCEIEPVLATLEDIAAIRNEHSMAKDIRPMMTPTVEPDMGKDLRQITTTTIEPDMQKDSMTSPALGQVPSAVAEMPTGGVEKAQASAEIEEMLKAIQRPDAANDPGAGDEDTMELAEDAPIIRMTNVLIQNAIKQAASDIHVEPEPAACTHPLPH